MVNIKYFVIWNLTLIAKEILVRNLPKLGLLWELMGMQDGILSLRNEPHGRQPNLVLAQHVSIPEFLQCSGTEAQCAEAFKQSWWPDWFRCQTGFGLRFYTILFEVIFWRELYDYIYWLCCAAYEIPKRITMPRLVSWCWLAVFMNAPQYSALREASGQDKSDPACSLFNSFLRPRSYHQNPPSQAW